ncbi:MAG: hypothetical protein ACR2F6_11635 [Mycobacteriales bacterium]
MTDDKPRWRHRTLTTRDGNRILFALRFVERDGRRVIDQVTVTGNRLTTADLRAVPMRAEEATANVPERRELDRVRREDREPSHEELRDLFGGSTAAAKDLRNRPGKRRRSLPARADGSDAFYRQVATAYGIYAAHGTAPGRDIAAEAGVPVTTAHRWIREARRRGFLTPGRKGTAG